jgi:hypothetical protein
MSNGGREGEGLDVNSTRRREIYDCERNDGLLNTCTWQGVCSRSSVGVWLHPPTLIIVSCTCLDDWPSPTEDQCSFQACHQLSVATAVATLQTADQILPCGNAYTRRLATSVTRGEMLPQSNEARNSWQTTLSTSDEQNRNQGPVVEPGMISIGIISYVLTSTT